MIPTDPLAGAPQELLDYFEASSALGSEELAIKPLNREAAAEQTISIREIPYGSQLGLVPLEDAGNSRPFCYITRGPAAGMVLQFNTGKSHALRYPSLADFVDALRQAKASGTHIEALDPVPIPAAAGQAGLVVQLLQALTLEPREAEATVESLLPLLDPHNVDVLETLSLSSNFLIRECVAVFLERHPCVQHEAIAQRLATDAYGQVARPAAAAAKLIRRMKWELKRDGLGQVLTPKDGGPLLR